MNQQKVTPTGYTHSLTLGNILEDSHFFIVSCTLHNGTLSRW